MALCRRDGRRRRGEGMPPPLLHLQHCDFMQHAAHDARRAADGRRPPCVKAVHTMHLEPPPARRRASRRGAVRGGRASQHPLDGMVRSPFVAAPVRGGEVGRVGRRTSAAHGYQLVAFEAHGMACRKAVVDCRLSAESLANPARPALCAKPCDGLASGVPVAAPDLGSQADPSPLRCRISTSYTKATVPSRSRLASLPAVSPSSRASRDRSV